MYHITGMSYDLEYLRKHDLEAYFNIHLVHAGARPAYLLEAYNDDKLPLALYMDVVCNSFPDLHFVCESAKYHRYFVTKEPVDFEEGVGLPDELIATKLGFDSIGIPSLEELTEVYTLTYYVDGVSFYAEVACDAETFVTKDAKLKSFQHVANQLGLSVSMEVRKQVILNVETYHSHRTYWDTHVDDALEYMMGAGMTYMSKYLGANKDILDTDLFLFALAQTEFDPFTCFLRKQPVIDPNMACLIEEIMELNFSLDKDPVASFDQSIKKFFDECVDEDTMGVYDDVADTRDKLMRTYMELRNHIHS